MKTKLTLSIESKTTHGAKRLARTRGTSLSQLVENLLSTEIGQISTETTVSTFSQRWAGTMQVAEKQIPATISSKKNISFSN